MGMMRARAYKMGKNHRWYALVKRLPQDHPIVGAEIGVLNGATSAKVLEALPNATHIMVDPWTIYNLDESYIKSNALETKETQEWFEENYRIALEDTEPYRNRRKVMRMKSVEAAGKIEDNSLDYIFIDGDHSFEGVQRDLTLWWPKLKPGGLMSGHDWASKRHPQVKEAIVDWFGRQPDETDVNSTWFIWKQ